MEEYYDYIDQIKNILANVDNETSQNILRLLAQVVGETQLSYEILNNPVDQLKKRNRIKYLDQLPHSPTVACQGVPGAYSHIAAQKIFENPDIKFLPKFSDVPDAIAKGSVDFGLLPFENSTAGDVDTVIELLCQSGCYITLVQPVKAKHCLAGIKGSSINDITEVFSHPQGLLQTTNYAIKHNFKQTEVANTALSAKLVSQWGDPTKGAICSELSAEIYGLEVLESNVQDYDENYTRFICISKNAIILPNADTMAIALSFPNEPGALSKFLTLFSLFNLDLSKIQSMPIGGTDFNVRFHLDFKGELKDKKVENLLGHMYEMYDDFQFLGNYKVL